VIVSLIFTGFMLWLQSTQKTTLNNDYGQWICFCFGWAYWIIVTIMVKTGSRVDFKDGGDKNTDENKPLTEGKQSDA